MPNATVWVMRQTDLEGLGKFALDGNHRPHMRIGIAAQAVENYNRHRFIVRN